MQLFMPHSRYIVASKMLDNVRRGKQIIESAQLLAGHGMMLYKTHPKLFDPNIIRVKPMNLNHAIQISMGHNAALVQDCVGLMLACNEVRQLAGKSHEVFEKSKDLIDVIVDYYNFSNLTQSTLTQNAFFWSDIMSPNPKYDRFKNYRLLLHIKWRTSARKPKWK